MSEKEPKSDGTKSAEAMEAEAKKKEVFEKLRDEMNKTASELAKEYDLKSSEPAEQILREKTKTYINSLPTEEIEIILAEAGKEIPKYKDLTDKLSEIFPNTPAKDQEAAVKFINGVLGTIYREMEKAKEEKITPSKEEKK